MSLQKLRKSWPNVVVRMLIIVHCASLWNRAVDAQTTAPADASPTNGASGDGSAAVDNPATDQPTVNLEATAPDADSPRTTDSSTETPTPGESDGDSRVINRNFRFESTRTKMKSGMDASQPRSSGADVANGRKNGGDRPSWKFGRGGVQDGWSLRTATKDSYPVWKKGEPTDNQGKGSTRVEPADADTSKNEAGGLGKGNPNNDAFILWSMGEAGSTGLRPNGWSLSSVGAQDVWPANINTQPWTSQIDSVVPGSGSWAGGLSYRGSGPGGTSSWAANQPADGGQPAEDWPDDEADYDDDSYTDDADGIEDDGPQAGVVWSPGNGNAGQGGWPAGPTPPLSRPGGWSGRWKSGGGQVTTGPGDTGGWDDGGDEDTLGWDDDEDAGDDEDVYDGTDVDSGAPGPWSQGVQSPGGSGGGTDSFDDWNDDSNGPGPATAGWPAGGDGSPGWAPGGGGAGGTGGDVQWKVYNENTQTMEDIEDSAGWKIVGDAEMGGWRLVDQQGNVEWKIENVDGEWRVSSPDGTAVKKQENGTVAANAMSEATPSGNATAVAPAGNGTSPPVAGWDDDKGGKYIIWKFTDDGKGEARFYGGGGEPEVWPIGDNSWWKADQNSGHGGNAGDGRGVSWSGGDAGSTQSPKDDDSWNNAGIDSWRQPAGLGAGGGRKTGRRRPSPAVATKTSGGGRWQSTGQPSGWNAPRGPRRKPQRGGKRARTNKSRIRGVVPGGLGGSWPKGGTGGGPGAGWAKSRPGGGRGGKRTRTGAKGRPWAPGGGIGRQPKWKQPGRGNAARPVTWQPGAIGPIARPPQRPKSSYGSSVRPASWQRKPTGVSRKPVTALRPAKKSVSDGAVTSAGPWQTPGTWNAGVPGDGPWQQRKATSSWQSGGAVSAGGNGAAAGGGSWQGNPQNTPYIIIVKAPEDDVVASGVGNQGKTGPWASGRKSRRGNAKYSTKRKGTRRISPWASGATGRSGWQWNATADDESWKWIDGWMGSGGGFGGWTKDGSTVYSSWRPTDTDESKKPQTKSRASKKSASKTILVFDANRKSSDSPGSDPQSSTKGKKVIVIDYTASSKGPPNKDGIKKDIVSVIRALKSAKPAEKTTPPSSTAAPSSDSGWKQQNKWSQKL